MTSDPAGAGGSGATGSRASVYTPTAQGSADALYQSLLNPAIPNTLGNQAINPGATPGGQAYATSQPYVSSFVLNNPGMTSYLAGANQAGDLGTAAAGYAQPAAANLFNLGNSLSGQIPNYQNQFQALAGQDTGMAGQLRGLTNPLIASAFDPQNALYNRQLNQMQQQIAAQNAASGVGGTPYGAGVANQGLSNFNIDWQNNLLNRMLAGAQGVGALDTGAGQLYGAAGNLVNQGANVAQNLASTAGNLYGQGQGQLGSGISNLLGGTGAGYGAYNTIGNNVLGAEGSLANLGNNQYLLPQQVMQDLQSYLGLGQAASQISGNLGQMGQNQLGTAASGFGSLLGSGLGLGSPSNPGYLASGIGSLFGGGGLFGGAAEALPAADYFTPLAGTLGGIADYGPLALLA